MALLLVGATITSSSSLLQAVMKKSEKHTKRERVYFMFFIAIFL
jgi:SNF family Na+-dependent transporter